MAGMTTNPFTGKPFVTSPSKTTQPTSRSITDMKPGTTSYNQASSQLYTPNTGQISTPTVIDTAKNIDTVQKQTNPDLANATQQLKDNTTKNIVDPSIINQDYAAKLNTALLQQQQNRATQVQDLNQQKSTAQNQLNDLADKINLAINQAPQTYDKQRSSAYVQAKQDLRGNNDILASRGLAGALGDVARSGESETGRIQRETALGNQLNEINTQQKNYINDQNNQLNSAQRDYNTKINDIAQKIGLIQSQGGTSDVALQQQNAAEVAKALQDAGVTNAKYQQNALNSYTTNLTSQDNTAYNRAEQAKKDYANTVGQFADDYQAQIDKVRNDGDPTNDWQIPILNNARQGKMATNLQNNIANIGQYSNDYSAEIDKRAAINPNDPLIPYLQNAHNQKVATQLAAQNTANETAYKNYAELFKQTGIVSTPEMSRALGLPIGTKSTDYTKTVYDTSKPYYKVSSGSSNLTRTDMVNNAMATDLQNLTSMSVANAIKHLTDNRALYVKTYGESGYENLWDSALANAIKAKQAQDYNTYFGFKSKSPNFSDVMNQYITTPNQ